MTAPQDLAPLDLGRIGVIGPGIVGAPMAALLAQASAAGHYGPRAHVTVVQRDSPTSGWKVAALNAGRSPIGGIEPGLEVIIAATAASGHLSASHDPGVLRDADVVLVCVQTDKAPGGGPDYGPMFGALEGLTAALKAGRDAGRPPALVIFESTLAPSSMATVMTDLFAAAGLVEGRDVFLGNSPNRVMPGRLVARIAAADKLAGGLHPSTPGRIAQLYAPLVTEGTVHPTNSLTAEVVKTLENTWRDVRIALAHEVAHHCDRVGVDVFRLRQRVNAELARGDAADTDAAAVPTGAMLVPGVGVGGHCLPKDGILMRWRFDEADPSRAARSLIHRARVINDAAPAYTARLAEALGPLADRPVTLLGLAYRADSDDTRNSPTFGLAAALRALGCAVTVHDPYVRPTDANLRDAGLTAALTADLDAALAEAEVAFLCQAHAPYRDAGPALLAGRPRLRAVVDAAHVWPAVPLSDWPVPARGVGRGGASTGREPDAELVQAVAQAHRALGWAFTRELAEVIDDLNARYAADDFQRVSLDTVRALAATCATGCDLPALGPVPASPFPSTLLHGSTLAG
ncbi:MAG: nucleotide sugar dehydrogenase [Myxococcales bacterium]|nr:nucleotide sugar dehydrogenase [Myxococcales bacterium]MCB9525064.1 nucleotide sugar dehydrogenase [Myxococcales bacterium]